MSSFEGTFTPPTFTNHKGGVLLGNVTSVCDESSSQDFPESTREDMQFQLLFQCFILHWIICASGVTGELLTIGAVALVGYLFFKPSTVEDIQNSRLLNGVMGGEACTEKFIRTDIGHLDHELKHQIHGQELAIQYITGALKNHFQNLNRNTKALTISLHGLPGTGKNYVSDVIVDNIFKKYQKEGTSRFVHKFNSRIHFPDDNKINMYKVQLSDWIISNVTACGRSFFIFDEVDKFPKGLLNVLKPFIDHHAMYNRVRFGNAVFIFLSNTGGKEIMERFFELQQAGWILSGRSRADLNLNDFESVTKIMAYNDEGGLGASDMIGHNVIDHYIPFLPLEKEHVVKCIENEYNYASTQTHMVKSKISLDQLKEYVLSGMTFIPEPQRLYSSTGCKRVKAKVGTYLSRHGIYY